MCSTQAVLERVLAAMVLGLSQVLAPLNERQRQRSRKRRDDDPSTEELVVAELVAKISKDLRAPRALDAEVAAALSSAFEIGGEEHCRTCAEFLTRYLAAASSATTSAGSTEIAMEALRIEGLKAIKKWRAWQAFKSDDRIDSLGVFLYSKPNSGTVHLEMSVADAARFVGGENQKFSPHVLAEAVARIADALEERLVEDDEVMALDCMARLHTLFEHVDAADVSEQLRCLGAAVLYLTQRIAKATGPMSLESVMGSGADFKKWMEDMDAACALQREAYELKVAGRTQHPALDILRSTDTLCADCGSQTYLVEKHLRRSDEPSDWFRTCPKCRVERRSSS